MASTNKTTNYELSQYIGTDKPTYLGDYNSDMSKIDTAIHGVAQNVGTESARIGVIETDVGTMGNLQTTDKSSLVNAINEVNTNSNNNTTNIGTLANLTTVDKTTLVNAINEVLYDIQNKGFAYVNTYSNSDQNSSGLTVKILANSTTTITTLGGPLLVDIFADVYNTNNTAYNYDIGIKIDNTTYRVITATKTGGDLQSAAEVITGIPAGQHEVSLYIQGTQGGSAIRCKAFDTYGYTVTEL